MVASHREVFEKFAKTVKNELGGSVKHIILFGSVAREEETNKSDIDVLVVVDDKAIKERIFDIAYDLMLSNDIYISPKVVSKSEYQRMKNRKKSFLKRIQPEATAYAKA